MSITTQIIATGAETTFTSVQSQLVNFMSLCNITSSSVLVNIHIVPDGDSPTTSNLFVSELEIIGKDTYVLYEGSEKIVFGNNDRIYVVTTDLSFVTVTNAITVVTSFVDF